MHTGQHSPKGIYFNPLGHGSSEHITPSQELFEEQLDCFVQTTYIGTNDFTGILFRKFFYC